MRFHIPSTRGFTLIELMIVVVVIGILAAIAYPSYQNYVLRSGRVDAMSSLLNHAQALDRCFTRQNTYVGCPNIPGTSQDELYDLSATIDATTYLLTAEPAGRQERDRCEEFTLDHRGEKSSRPADGCWN